MIALYNIFFVLPFLWRSSSAATIRKPEEIGVAASGSTISVPDAQLGQPYNVTLATKPDGTDSGYLIRNTTALVEGLQLTGTTLSGIPLRQGRYRMGFTVVNGSSGATSYNTVELVVHGMQISQNKDVQLIANAPFLVTVPTEGGVGNLRYEIQGADWARVVGNSLVGTAPAAGSYVLSLTVTDQRNNTVTSKLNMIVQGNQIKLNPQFVSLVASSVNSQEFSVSGGQPPYSFRYQGLPDGLTGSRSKIYLSGKCSIGKYTVSVEVTDANNSVSRFPVTVSVVGSLPNPTYSQPANAKSLWPLSGSTALKVATAPIDPPVLVASSYSNNVEDLGGVFVAHIQQVGSSGACKNSQQLKTETGSGIITSISDQNKQYTVDGNIVLEVFTCRSKLELSSNGRFRVGDLVEWTAFLDAVNPNVMFALKLVKLVPPQHYQP